MQTFSNPLTMKPSIAEQRRAIPIPAPFDRASKALMAEFDALRAKADALETERRDAALHRKSFANELEELTSAGTEVDSTADESKKSRQIVAEETGLVGIEEDRSIAFEAMTVRDVGLGLLRKELSLRNELAGYLERWQIEGRKAVAALREKLEETRQGVRAWLIKGHSKYGGFHNPEMHKLSPGRVLPGYVNSHPAVIAAAGELRAIEGTLNGTKPTPENDREIKELRRLIRSEVAQLAGMGGS